jgi:hypothetical protein
MCLVVVHEKKNIYTCKKNNWTIASIALFCHRIVVNSQQWCLTKIYQDRSITFHDADGSK